VDEEFRDLLWDLRNYSSEMSISQVVKFFKKHDVDFTKTTIQHYVRVGALPPPAGRKYSESHIAGLAMIAWLRSVFSLEEIRRLLLPVWEAGAARDSYSLLLSALQAEVRHNTDAHGADPLGARLALAARSLAAKAGALI
jgi:DNA-binding transcriptional MerR regulator